MTRYATRLALAAGLLAVAACSEQTPEDAAIANMGAFPGDVGGTPPGELPASVGAGATAPASDSGGEPTAGGALPDAGL